MLRFIYLQNVGQWIHLGEVAAYGGLRWAKGKHAYTTVDIFSVLDVVEMLFIP